MCGHFSHKPTSHQDASFQLIRFVILQSITHHWNWLSQRMATIQLMSSPTSPIRSMPSLSTSGHSDMTSVLFPRLIPEVKETSVVLSGILEAFGLPSSSPIECPTSGHESLGRRRSVGHGVGHRGGANRGQKVIVCVYRTSREHFAVVYPLRMIISARTPIMTINLRTTSVQKLAEDVLSLEQSVEKKSYQNCSGQSGQLLLKMLASSEQIDRWMDALVHSSPRGSPKSGHRSPIMNSSVYTPVMDTVAEMSEEFNDSRG